MGRKKRHHFGVVGTVRDSAPAMAPTGSGSNPGTQQGKG
jgi:hypothetical protein